MASSVAIVALGANLGECEKILREALKRLENAGTRILGVSSFYETVPVGYENQPDFINAVAALEISQRISPEILMQRLLDVEKSLGRERPFQNAPRTCDLDLLFFDDQKRETKFLTLPHPRWRERAFVLVPLVELFAAGTVWSALAPWKNISDEASEILRTLDVSGVRVCPEK